MPIHFRRRNGVIICGKVLTPNHTTTGVKRGVTCRICFAILLDTKKGKMGYDWND